MITEFLISSIVLLAVANTFLFLTKPKTAITARKIRAKKEELGDYHYIVNYIPGQDSTLKPVIYQPELTSEEFFTGKKPEQNYSNNNDNYLNNNLNYSDTNGNGSNKMPVYSAPEGNGSTKKEIPFFYQEIKNAVLPKTNNFFAPNKKLKKQKQINSKKKIIKETKPVEDFYSSIELIDSKTDLVHKRVNRLENVLLKLDGTTNMDKQLEINTLLKRMDRLDDYRRNSKIEIEALKQELWKSNKRNNALERQSKYSNGQLKYSNGNKINNKQNIRTGKLDKAKIHELIYRSGKKN